MLTSPIIVGLHGMISPNAILILNFASTWFMVGLIWIVQVVHYPLFENVGDAGYVDYQRRHQWRITLVVGPVMLLEMATTLGLVYLAPASVSPVLVWGGVLALLIIWFSTAFLQIPCHGRLERGFETRAHRFLVSSNWIRTVGWTVRGAITGWMVWGWIPVEL